jgi:hypothetical protein
MFEALTLTIKTHNRLSGMFLPAIGDAIYRLSGMLVTGYRGCFLPANAVLVRVFTSLTTRAVFNKSLLTF